jgi:SAM-dependent methyltransferase
MTKSSWSHLPFQRAEVLSVGPDSDADRSQSEEDIGPDDEFDSDPGIGDLGIGEVAVRNEYARHPGGATGWYQEHGAQYRNPHEAAVRAMIRSLTTESAELFAAGRILDLACGSGEVTLALIEAGVAPGRIDASDPYTAEAFHARTGSSAEGWSFRDIATGAFEGREWETVICSYALHLCEPTWLAAVCLQLSLVASNLIIITPHKRPEISDANGWILVDETRDLAHRVRTRTYLSSNR